MEQLIYATAGGFVVAVLFLTFIWADRKDRATHAEEFARQRNAGHEQRIDVVNAPANVDEVVQKELAYRLEAFNRRNQVIDVDNAAASMRNVVDKLNALRTLNQVEAALAKAGYYRCWRKGDETISQATHGVDGVQGIWYVQSDGGLVSEYDASSLCDMLKKPGQFLNCCECGEAFCITTPNAIYCSRCEARARRRSSKVFP